MQRNIAMIERVVRVIVGAAIIMLGFEQTATAWWGWLGLVPLVTGVVGHCPLYALAEHLQRSWHHRHPPRAAT